MNRIRQTGEGFEVLLSPRNTISPDCAYLIGAFDDADVHNFTIATFTTLQAAQAVALSYPDIEWVRIVKNHQFIFQRLDDLIRDIITRSGIDVEVESRLMGPNELKELMFDRTLNNNAKSRTAMNNIISFRISNPWTANLIKIVELLLAYKSHGYRDDLRIRDQEMFDRKIFILTGVTEVGTMYEIKLVPSLLKFGLDSATKEYPKLLQQQNLIDKGPVAR
jgi:hypothetical protein